MDKNLYEKLDELIAEVDEIQRHLRFLDQQMGRWFEKVLDEINKGEDTQ